MKEIYGKTVLVMDYIDSGRSLNNASTILKEYFEKKNIRIESAGFANTQSIGFGKTQFNNGKHFTGHKFHLDLETTLQFLMHNFLYCVQF